MHTKGPWKANKEEDGQYNIDAWFDESVTVATVWNEPEAKDNALLVAAAPELRRGCMLLLSAIDTQTNDNPKGDEWAMAQAKKEALKAIHKALDGLPMFEETE